MSNLAPSFLIGSSSFLQVSRTCMKAWMSLNFGKFATELWPLIDVRIWFLLNILKTNSLIKTKFCIHIIIDKIYVGIVNHCFSQICKRVTALDWFLLNILRTNFYRIRPNFVYTSSFTTTPIYGKNPLKIFFYGTGRQISTNLSM